MTEPVWLVVGLGNPGPSYAGNRHNVGYLVNDELASRVGGAFRSHKSGRADVVEGRLGGRRRRPRVVLARPRCYMNETGGPVAALTRSSTRCPVERVVAIHDELDIPFDTLRVKLGGGDNGHNGLRSMRALAGLRRLLPGPGRHRPAAGPPVAGRLRALADYSSVERKVLPFQVDRAADAVESLLTDGPRPDPERLQQLTAR